MKRLFEKAAILVHPTQRGGGGPHVCVEFAKEDCVEIYYGNVSYKYARIILFERAYSYFLHLFYVWRN